MSTLLHRLAQWAEETPLRPAQTYKEGGVWKEISAREYCNRVYWMCLYLETQGMTANDVSCIYSANNPQWVHTDLGAILLGAKSAGVYPNSTAKEVEYILEHTEAKIIGVQNHEFFSRITVPARVERIIVFEGDASFSPKAITYKEALAKGEALAKTARPLNDYLAKLDPHAGQFIIYTSGTTGTPKGAMLSNDNFCYTSDRASDYWKLPPEGSLFSFLPLCHVAEKIHSIGVGISNRYTTHFATKFENVGTELPEVQPTLLLCVPRLWEKMMEGVMNKIARGKGAKKKLAEWALGVGERVAVAKYAPRFPNPLDLIQLPIADKLVLSKIRQALGVGKAGILASGAAALPPHVSKWFRILGLEIYEDFGQTESTGVICMTEPGIEASGTVGKPVPGMEVKLAEDGEVLTRGRHVFKGYFKNPEATAETVRDGWLHTGDLGEIDVKTGMMKIRGRKKEILKTSGGKMIAPLPLEERLKAAPSIGQVCMVGDGRKYISALITLSESKMEELKSKNALTGPLVTDVSTLNDIKSAVDGLNKTLASFEQIKKFAVLAKEFSIVEGEMTPTLKMKRNIIESHYKSVIDSLYNSSEVA
jgi:long-chain acyl-CoA synthetase